MDHPQRLGKYQIRGILGEGGMGIVYLGYDPHLARQVAIKTIHRPLLDGKTGSELRERFRREARAEGRLIHSNIVTIHEYQEDDSGMPFFVMEFVEGKSLKECLASGRRFSFEECTNIIYQVLSALTHSHQHGIVHRDIKPANIILLQDGSVKIADFGIAKMEESEFTKTGMILGTPQYLSPEQCMGKPTDARSDLYSAGAVFYELLTGKKAFPGTSVTSILSRLQNDDVTTIDSEDPLIQRVFQTVISKALAKEPNDRFSSAREFSMALSAVVAQPEDKAGSNNARKWWWLGAASLIIGIALLLGLRYLPTTDPEPHDSKPLDAATQQKLQQHLKVAKLHYAMGRLLLPESGSAYAAYQMALQIDPANQVARSGVEEIEQQVVTQVNELVSSGKQEEASALIVTASRFFPENQQLRALRNETGRNE